MLDGLTAYTAALAAAGQRRLLVIEGGSDACLASLLQLQQCLPGDWLTVGPMPLTARHCLPAAIRTLLGQEFTHAVFDARDGMAADALAALSGTLRAGSWLVLLTPCWSQWPQRPDGDSPRWSDGADPIPTPHFIHHLVDVLGSDADVVHWRLPDAFPSLSSISAPRWQPAQGEALPQQQRILAELMALERGVAVVTAARGRGKSALAGMLAAAWPGRIMVTAPTKASAAILMQHAQRPLDFCAPDALRAAIADGSLDHYDWLMVDEAAAVPAPLLRRLLAGFTRALMTTTVQGYEGTGRGFILKLCASLPELHGYRLDRPVRWAEDDPLERVISALLLLDDADFAIAPVGACQIENPSQRGWTQQPVQMAEMYRLLSGAHYRTSPLDLRRMMDAPGQAFSVARAADGRLTAALWLVTEGGLAPGLSEAVWAGRRRPRGNLVAQSLAAHGGSPHAAVPRGLRITRIAVHPARQREGLGSMMIDGARHTAKADYLSVSFGLTAELWRFWQRCGFTLVRIGSHREASSGCYTAMALLPLSPAGEALTQRENRRLRRDALALQALIAEPLPVAPLLDAALNDDDWLELAGFAFAHRPPEAGIGSFTRLLLRVTAEQLPALAAWVASPHDAPALCSRFALSGRKALLVRLRDEVAKALYTLDAARAETLKRHIASL